MKSSKQLSRLLPRDDHLCGIHVDGCGKQIRNRAKASVDHILTKSFFKDREDGIRPKHYNEDWNCQPMHPDCNAKRGGQILGFPLFICSCHWLQIDHTPNGHVLKLHYKRDVGEFQFKVTTEKHDFVFGNLATGENSAQFGGSPEIEISSLWSMGQLKPGNKGIAGPGQLGHSFPRLDPEEVPEFNRIELERVLGISSRTIEKYNRRMTRMWVHFEVV